MCTAICDNGLFGRTLDLEYSLDESVIITPKNYKFPSCFKNMGDSHLSMIGSACMFEGAPLYYDAVNECGLAMAALNFPNYALYHPFKKDYDNIPSFELIPYILGRCDSISSAVEVLKKVNVIADSISASLPATPLHWIISDGKTSLCVESTKDGVNVYIDSFDVLTNSPDFRYQTENLSKYLSIDSYEAPNKLCPHIDILPVSRGMGCVGLPGDMSSPSRFVRAVFFKNHTSNIGKRDISRFFHIAESVSIPLGSVKTDSGKPISTVYTSCIDTQKCIYYFTTYNCRRIRSVDLYQENLSGNCLIKFPHHIKEDILELN